MADLRISKLNELNNQTTALEEDHQGTGGAQQPISFTNDKTDDPVTAYVKNPEFLKLSHSEQVEALKKQFPNVDEKTLVETLKTVVSTLKVDEGKIPADGAQAEDSPNQEVSEMDKLLEDYAKSLGEGKTIDDVFSVVLSKKQANFKFLSVEERKIYNYYKDVIKGEAFDGKTNATMMKTFMDSYSKLPEDKKDAEPGEKLDWALDAAISKHVKNYDRYSEDAKKALRAQYMDRIGSNFDAKWNEHSDAFRNIQKGLMAVVLDDISQNGDIKEINKNPQIIKEHINSLYQKNIGKAIFDNSGVNVASEEYQSKSPVEQLDCIADAALTKALPSYNSCTEEEKQALKKQMIDHIGKNLFGKEEWEEHSDLRDALVYKINVIKFSEKSMQEWHALSKADRDSLEMNYDGKFEKPAPTMVKVIRSMRANGIKVEGDFKENQIIEYLEKKVKDGTITEDEKAYLQKLKVSHKIDKDRNHKVDEFSVENRLKQHYSYKDKDGNIKIRYGEFLKDYCKKNGIEFPELAKNEEMLQKLFKDCGDAETVKQLCNVLNIKDYDKYLTKNQVVSDLSEATVNGDKTRAEDGVKWLDNNGHKELNQNYAEDVIPEYAPQMAETVYEKLLSLDPKGDKYTDSVAAGTNKLDIDLANQVSKKIDTSDNISDAAKSSYTKTLVETAPTPERQLSYAQNLSTIDNAAVTEGLAAASKSVNESVRQQYNNYVETATQRYSPEQQATIKSAMQTGQISQKTLSQTTPPSKSASQDNSSKSSDSTGKSSDNAAVKTSGNVQNQTQTQASTQSQAPKSSSSSSGLSNALPNSIPVTTQKTPEKTPVQGSQKNTQTSSSMSSYVSGSTGSTTTKSESNQISGSKEPDEAHTPSSYSNVGESGVLQTPQQPKVGHFVDSSISSDVQKGTYTPEQDEVGAPVDIPGVYESSSSSVEARVDIPTEDVKPKASSIDEISMSGKDIASQAMRELNEFRADYDKIILEGKRDVAAAEAKAVADEIKASVQEAKLSLEEKVEQEKQAAHEINKMVDKVIDNLAFTKEISITQRDIIKDKIRAAGNITNIYRIIESMGAKDLFLDRLLNNGSSYAIREFINSMNGNDSLLLDMYMRTRSETVRRELLNSLPESRIHSLLDSNRISNLKDVDYSVLLSYISKNIGLMSYDKFISMMQYLRGNDLTTLVAKYNDMHGASIKIGDAVAVPGDKKLMARTPEATTPDKEKQQKTDKKQVDSAEISSPEQAKTNDDNQTKVKSKNMFASSGVTTLNDGRIVKQKGSFAGISDKVQDEEAYDDITEIAMNDQVLTPGSYEWRMKYGKMEAKKAPTTAFTMADMEENDLLTEGYPPQQVPNWKYKGKNKGINFKG